MSEHDEKLLSWRKRITELQKSTLSPQDVERIKRMSDNQQCLLQASKRASNLKSASVMSAAVVSRGIRNLSAPARAVSQQQEVSTVERRLASIHQALNDVAVEQGEADQHIQLVSHELEEEDSTDQLVGTRPPVDDNTWLNDLVHEPSNDDDRCSKFLLYERFLEVVQMTRERTLQFWVGMRAHFDGSALQETEKVIRNIDSEHALSIPDNPSNSRWFVYDMAVKAQANNLNIQGVIDVIQRKVDLLASQGDCPICLESFNAEDPEAVTVLGCCHKVCTACWSHFMSLHVHSAPCPLCRRDEFFTHVFV
eukprot:c4491_g1_i1.p1 GENE.c4491_g1_i1~~c4491_g1_i1.p1  ORF type:complete len:322 (-),score=59.18 c4491_g1_i1:382-1308(-)